jgi:hypothetical protein
MRHRPATAPSRGAGLGAERVCESRRRLG